MDSFLQQTANRIVERFDDFEQLTIIVPSNRAKKKLLKCIAIAKSATFLAPQFQTVASFTAELSELREASSESLVCIASHIYVRHVGAISFSQFVAVGRSIISDFNEIDRYQVSPKDLFEHIGAIERVEQWGQEPTEMIAEYTTYAQKLALVYQEFSQFMLDSRKGTNGIIYKKAAENIANYTEMHQEQRFLFVGLNALNGCEIEIINHLLEENQAEVYFDLDTYFVNNKLHDAGLFVRRLLEKWDKFKDRIQLFGEDTFTRAKSIDLVGVTKVVGQAMYLNDVLCKPELQTGKVAVVLADESLLPTVIATIPINEEVNITMGYPVITTKWYKAFDYLIRLAGMLLEGNISMQAQQVFCRTISLNCFLHLVRPNRC